VEENRIERVENGIETVGFEVEIVRNEIEGVRGTAIETSGPETLLSKNRISTAGTGIVMTGAALVVTKNRVDGVNRTYSARVDCYPGLGDRCRFEKNEIRKHMAQEQTVELNGTSPAGFVVRKNELRDSEYEGLHVTASNSRVEKNEVRGAGRGAHACFLVAGNDNEISENRATECGDAGYVLRGARGVAIENRALRPGHVGFELSGSVVDMVMKENRSEDAIFHGFHLVGDGVVSAELVENRAKGSRYGLCDRGTGTSLDDNDFDIASSTGQACGVD